MPLYWHVGYSIVDRIQWNSPESPTALTALHPTIIPGRGKLVDTTKLGFYDPLPEKFIFGDGSSERAFVGVDRSSGSQLSRWIQRIEKQIHHLESKNFPFPVLESLRLNVANNVGMVKGNESKCLPWDKRFQLPPVAMKLANLPSDHVPVPWMPHLMPVVPAEAFIIYSEGYCGQQAYLNSLVLRQFGIPNRIVNGGIAYFLDGKLHTYGHTWVELERNQILDTGRQMLGFVARNINGKIPVGYPNEFTWENDWYQIPGEEITVDGKNYPAWRFEYNRYFIVSLDS